ncbi:hypothetical protein NKI79_25100 [Mesorhizobium sp. M0340]|uniref:hypothetical protein n=1 Tax=Mesorhizobium sp. M0340 TaxID=2956939 RepID=UPI00333A5A02
MADLNRRIVDTLARAFEDRSADRFPALAVSCRKCRVGSTALTNLFGIAGFPSSSRSRLSCGSRRLVNMARPGSCADHRNVECESCLMVSSILAEPVPARQSAEEQLSY